MCDIKALQNLLKTLREVISLGNEFHVATAPGAKCNVS